MLTIPGKRIHLRDWKIDEIDAFSAWDASPQVMKYASWRSFSKEESMTRLQTAVNESIKAKRKSFYLAIELNESNAIIGDAGFMVIAETDNGGIAEIGYFLYESYWKKGYGTEAASMLIEYIFQHTTLHKVIACCDKRNVGSWKVMQKCGMTKERENRMGRLQQGSWCDGLEYGILKDEWNQACWRTLL